MSRPRAGLVLLHAQSVSQSTCLGLEKQSSLGKEHGNLRPDMIDKNGQGRCSLRSEVDRG